jgi:Hint domain
VLIPAGLLVNGTTVAPVEVEEISYWHVELDSHDILIANNLPAESYLAMGNRTFFAEARATFEALEGGERTYADFCRPVATDGPVLDFVRDRLTIQAQTLGWTPSRDADLHLLVDGEIHHPLAEGDAAVFLLCDSARDVRLVSNTFVPARIGLGDNRELGVSLYGLAFEGSGGEARRVSLDDPRLAGGLHSDEATVGAHWRWTKGELVLDPQFWAGLTGHIALFVNHNAQTTRQWIPPARPAEVIPVKSKSKQRLYSVR